MALKESLRRQSDPQNLLAFLELYCRTESCLFLPEHPYFPAGEGPHQSQGYPSDSHMSAMGWKETRTASTIQSLLSERVIVPACWSAIQVINWLVLSGENRTIEVCEEDALGLRFQGLRERHHAITLSSQRVKRVKNDG